MKKWLCIFWIFSLCGCSMLRKVDRTDTKTQFFESEKRVEYAPGDKVFYAIPQIPKERPKSQTVQTKGDNGATLNTRFNDQGEVEDITCECPEIKKQNDILRALLEEEKRKTTEATKETKGININIIVIAAMALVFLYLDKRT